MLNLEEFKSKYNYEVATPMMKQYLDIKFENQDVLLLFRMGDFYELFFDDAKIASKALSLALAKRGKHGEDDLPMCGMPHHALEGYMHKLLDQDFKVAICDQLESPEEAKKRGYKAIVKRGVSRIITPGTITEESILPEHNPNYLAALKKGKQNISVAYLDISTAIFKVISTPKENLAAELSRISPKELIISEKDKFDPELKEILSNYESRIVVQVDSNFARSKCQKIIERFYDIHSYESIGYISEEEICSIGAVLEYVNITQKSTIPNLSLPHNENISEFMVIDSSTRRNLELTSTISGSYKGSLLCNVNHTITKPGGRLLHEYLSSPLLSKNEIIFRQDNIEYLLQDDSLRNNIREILKSVSDIERILIRISSSRSIPRDLIALKESIISGKEIATLLKNDDHKFLERITSNFKNFDGIIDLIDKAINEDAPNNLVSGGIIKKSYDSALGDLYDLVENSDQILKNLRDEYRQKTAIETLKICNNNVIGMFIEVTPKNAHKMNHEEFIHKQTLASSVRYTSEKLREIEVAKNNAHIQIIQIEQKIYNDICQEVLKHISDLRNLALSIAMIDVFSGLAMLAKEYNYCRPIIDESTDFEIRDGRHVNVEMNLHKGAFTPNDCNLSRDQRLWLLTGPNMAGKSTFLRQNAIIAILAQIGSFVPASYAKIGIIDKLFSRIGASDDISKGQSTFMVEMIEAASILANSTERSFIILDEVGRGTSTYDGLSIAWGCLEHIHNKLLSRCLFATHYHELTILSKSEPSLKNFTMDIREENGKLVFLHKVIEGVADKSYGIHVAEIAGLPKQVVKRAYQVLGNLEKDKLNKEKDIDNIISNNYSLFDIESTKIQHKDSQVEKRLGDLKPDELSPREALDLIYELKKELA